MRKKTPKLKPCPFCGGRASLFRVQQSDGSITYEAECGNEDCEVSACTALHDTREVAVAVWNARCKGIRTRRNHL